ncbi:two-component system sensor histidine kinase CreC [Massilia sp. BJB1822]|uniref:two-component system sensor histidine kinase CreC n=1 Tax=Massilia sp. BJB1822 TaxID=2744470 RepID=UPI00159369FE|nr:two-component system sensor histidine kinase CreC [Massilia sp. BJB1822]NVD99703.1 two-component system sensor histidine kinase CreC [Massilia sp. BJB1822]
MKIGLRILLGYFLIVGLAAWFLLNVFVQQVKPGVRGALEDTLVDTAQVLAAAVADDMQAGRLEHSPLLDSLRGSLAKGLDMKISGVPKDRLHYRIYLTDAAGIVRFDSSGRDVGQDYSRWNDVYLTLRGRYGARSTREYAEDDASTVMYVAAPVRAEGRIIGVLTVAKPIASVQAFIERSQRRILSQGAVLLGVSLLIGIAVTFWLARALHRLTDYVAAVQAGRKAVLPALGKTEIGTLGAALEAMRVKLEGKEYVETLMHTLAHELKSPIAAIQAAAELMQEDMPEQERRHFLANIQSQNARQRQLIDRLLALVRLEKQQRLDAPETVDLAQLLRQAASDCSASLAARGLDLQVQPAEADGAPEAALRVQGDALLLRQALGNLLDNAIGFAPAGSRIMLAVRRQGDQAEIAVTDGGPGIPAYAAERLFERFYSLPRPDGAKSTGLGLPFVREVASLHGGSVDVGNADQGGCRAVLRLPLPLRL